MGIDHRRFDIGMTQKLLDGSNIATAFKQVSGEGMSEVAFVNGLRTLEVVLKRRFERFGKHRNNEGNFPSCL